MKNLAAFNKKGSLNWFYASPILYYFSKILTKFPQPFSQKISKVPTILLIDHI